MLTKEASKTVLHVFKDRFLVSRNDRNDNNSCFLDTPHLTKLCNDYYSLFLKVKSVIAFLIREPL